MSTLLDDTNECINWLAEQASEFNEFEDILEEVKARFTPAVVITAIDTYGANFTSLRHVYEDMRQRAAFEYDGDSRH